MSFRCLWQDSCTARRNLLIVEHDGNLIVTALLSVVDLTIVTHNDCRRFTLRYHPQHFDLHTLQEDDGGNDQRESNNDDYFTIVFHNGRKGTAFFFFLQHLHADFAKMELFLYVSTCLPSPRQGGRGRGALQQDTRPQGMGACVAPPQASAASEVVQVSRMEKCVKIDTTHFPSIFTHRSSIKAVPLHHHSIMDGQRFKLFSQ